MDRVITVAALVLTDWAGHALRDGETWRYTFTATIQPQQLVDGQLVAIEGADLTLLTQQCGLEPGLRHDAEYPAGADGSAPSSGAVGPAMLGWVQAAITAAIDEWVGRTVRLTVEQPQG